jgi:hypothetical protein
LDKDKRKIRFARKWKTGLRPDFTSAFSRRNAKYFACFFGIATTRINYFYLSAHNSKETKFTIHNSKDFAEKKRSWNQALKIETKRYLAAFAQAAREVVPLPRRPYHLIDWLPPEGV